MSNIKVPEGKGYRYGEVLESHSTDLRHLFAMAIGALATKQGRWYNIRSHHNDANSLSYSLGLTIGELLALLHHAGMAKTVKKTVKMTLPRPMCSRQPSISSVYRKVARFTPFKKYQNSSISISKLLTSKGGREIHGCTSRTRR